MLQLQKARRRDPQPFTWEIPVGILTGVLLVLVLGVALARSVANVLAGGTWQWGRREDLFTGLAGVLRGDATAGLDPAALAAAGATASPALLWSCIAVTEVLLVVLLGLLTKVGLNRWGPGRVQGMASTTEAEQLLGLSRLRRVAPLIRPDLYSRNRARPTTSRPTRSQPRMASASRGWRS